MQSDLLAEYIWFRFKTMRASQDFFLYIEKNLDPFINNFTKWDFRSNKSVNENLIQ